MISGTTWDRSTIRVCYTPAHEILYMNRSASADNRNALFSPLLKVANESWNDYMVQTLFKVLEAKVLLT